MRLLCATFAANTVEIAIRVELPSFYTLSCWLSELENVLNEVTATRIAKSVVVYYRWPNQKNHTKATRRAPRTLHSSAASTQGIREQWAGGGARRAVEIWFVCILPQGLRGLASFCESSLFLQLSSLDRTHECVRAVWGSQIKPFHAGRIDLRIILPENT